MLSIIILGAISGALAGVVAKLVVRGLPHARRYYAAIFVLVLAALFGVGTVFVDPAVRATRGRSEAERLIDSSPAYRMISQEHPEFRAQFVDFIVELERQGATRDEAYSRGAEWGREHLAPFVVQYIPHASDSAAVLFATAFRDVIGTLRFRDPKGCTALLFGSEEKPPPPLPRFSPEHERAMTDAFNAILVAATAARRPPVDSATGNRLLSIVLARLEEDHGGSILRDIRALGNPATARSTPSQSCNASYALYSGILKLPQDQAGTLLRFLFASASH